jgi:hypothetical protein
VTTPVSPRRRLRPYPTPTSHPPAGVTLTSDTPEAPQIRQMTGESERSTASLGECRSGPAARFGQSSCRTPRSPTAVDTPGRDTPQTLAERPSSEYSTNVRDIWLRQFRVAVRDALVSAEPTRFRGLSPGDLDAALDEALGFAFVEGWSLRSPAHMRRFRRQFERALREGRRERPAEPRRMTTGTDVLQTRQR